MSDKVDFSKFTTYASPEQAAADKKKTLSFDPPYKDKGVYRFRQVGSSQGVSSNKEYTDPTTGEVSKPKGRHLIYELWQPLNADGSVAFAFPEVETILTLFTSPDPALLKAVGYTDEQVAHAVSLGTPDKFVYSIVKQRFGARDPETFFAKKDENGVWTPSKEEMYDRVMAFQEKVWQNPEILKGDEVYFHVDIEEKEWKGKTYKNVRLKYPSHDIPKEKDGTPKPVLNPEAQ